MKRRLVGLVALLPLLTPFSQAGELRGVQYTPIAGGTRVTLELSAPTTGKVFRLSSPDRLVIDLPQTTARNAPAAPQGNLLRSVRSGPQKGGGLRVAFDLGGAASWRQSTLPAAGKLGPRLQIDVVGASAAVARSVPPRRTPAAAKKATSVPINTAPLEPPIAAVETAPGKPVLKSKPAGAVTVVIDAGHGGHDVGAIGPGRLYEKAVTLALARELAAQINAQRGMRAVLTRGDDRFIELRDRTAVAHRNHADLFVSIHADAVAGGGARGSSVYALSEHGASSEAARLLAARENASGMPPGLAVATQDRVLRSVLLDLSQNATIEGSLRLGERLLDRISDVNKLHRSDVQQAGFMVLKSPQVPSVLVETAFISDATEARKLADPAFRRRFAGALLAGIRDYLQTEPRLRQALAEAQTGRTAALRAADDGRPDDGG
jgi:N-acetylmuramoyl-L-alanine amidase